MSPEDKHFIEAVNKWRNDSPEQIRIRQLEAALIEIEKFGHSTGHARGYTCANIAQKTLGAKK